MPESSIALADENATIAFAQRLAAQAQPGDAVLLSGPLGAGKTSFARGFIRALAGDPQLEIPSPSFTLVQEYTTPAGPVFHYDLWRLDGPAALPELAWDEALAGIVLVEWPERLGDFTPRPALHIRITPLQSGRDVTWHSENGKWFDAS